MSADLQDDKIAAFDRALDGYMSNEIGAAWRGMCHQSAKVSAIALRQLYSHLPVELKRVELVALMEGAGRFVHIGWADDPAQIPGKIPAHFAVSVGSALYDPTFHQLRSVKTPLELPDEPYFYAERFLVAAPMDPDGFRWVGLSRSKGTLRVGYKVHGNEHLNLPRQALMSDSQAHAHAAAVVALVTKESSSQ